MTFVKSANGDTISAVNRDGKLVGQITKNRMGTHGHWHGWLHYPYCDEVGKCVWACVDRCFVFGDKDPETRFTHWTNEPPCFSNISEFKQYYFRKETEK